MLDIKLLRQDLPMVLDQLARRGFTLEQAYFKDLETERKTRQITVEALQNQRKVHSKSIGQAKAKGESIVNLMAEVEHINTQLASAETQLESLQQKLDAFLLTLPNLPDETTPEGKHEKDNQELLRWGTQPTFAFEAVDHVQLGEQLGGMDYETAAKITGARFCVLRGDLARLHRALTQFMLDTHVQDHGYEEVNVPFVVQADTLRGTGQLPKFEEDLFSIQGDRDWFLIPTAEVPVTNLVRQSILETEQLPKRWVAHTPCFRSEAGAYGRDTRGLIRQHQFEKVELVHIVHPEDAMDALEILTGHAEQVLKRLDLPFRRVALCAGDLGFSALKTYDLEVWLPGQQAYREISSCSNCGDFQARRMQARFRSANSKKPQLLHTLNGSGLAVGRTLIAVMENYQNADRSIQIPDALIPYMGKQRIG